MTFWAGTWGDESEARNKKWMEKIIESMNDKIRQVQELPITEQKLGKNIKKFLVKNTGIKITKTSNSNAGMDRGSKQSTKMANTRKDGDLLNEKDYRPITCLNTSFKIFTGILGQHVKKHVIQKDLWNKSQMGTCEKH